MSGRCYFCSLEYTGQHMVDCPGLMPPASHVPAIAMPGVEDEDRPIELRPVADAVTGQNSPTGNLLASGDVLVDGLGCRWVWDPDSGWLPEDAIVTGTD